MLLLIIFCVTITAVTSTDIPQDIRVWCYYTNWAQYRPGDMKYTVKDLDISKCTHAAFAFAIMSQQNTIKAFEWNDEDSNFRKRMYSKFTSLKSQQPNLKTYLSVGGWNFGAAPFTWMANSRSNRTAFIKSTIPFLRKYKFDGLDLDWEYPSDPDRYGIPEDKEYFVLLIKELYEAYKEESQKTGQPQLQLTIAAPAAKQKIDAGMDVKRFIKYLDYVNLMTYDFHGAWSNKTGHSSPLYPLANETGNDRYWNVAFSVTYWYKLGTPKSKINIGIPFYGRSFTLRDPRKFYLGADAKGAGKNGTVTRIGGFLSYFEACYMRQKGGKRYFIDEQKGPYMVLGDQWLGYEDKHSITMKVHWLREHGYTGVMIWTMDLDDYRGHCNEGKYPLANTVIKALKETDHLPKNGPDYDMTQDLNKACFNKPFGYYPHWCDCQKFVYCDTFMDGIVGSCSTGKVWDQKKAACVMDTLHQCTTRC